MKVLIVDDSKLIRENLKNIINKFYSDFEIIEAINSEEGITKSIINKPDFIFLDVIMPGLSGIETTKILREKVKSNAIIFIITSLEDVNIIEEAFDNGANDFILKPFREIEIYTRLKVYIELTEYIEILENLSQRDMLTGLYNRAYINEWAQQEECLFSIIIFDIDNFKKVNDTFGHITGDFVLKKIGNVLREYENPLMLPFRYGGEEFAIVLRKYDKKSALIIANEIIKKVKAIQFEHNQVKFKITLSAGISDKLEGKTFDEILEISDKRLYFSKINGKDMITIE